MKRSVGKLERPFGKLHYEVTGSGPALVFAHGLGGNQMSWWQQDRDLRLEREHRGRHLNTASPDDVGLPHLVAIEEEDRRRHRRLEHSPIAPYTLAPRQATERRLYFDEDVLSPVVTHARTASVQ